MKRSALCLALVLIVAGMITILASDHARAAPAYTVKEIPPLPGDLSVMPWGINNIGQIVGWSSDGRRVRPFIFADATGTVPLEGLPGRPNGSARDISEASVIVGSAWGDHLDMPGHAARWTNGIVKDLGVFDGAATSEAWGANDTGAAVGNSPAAGYGFYPRPFLYTDEAGMVDFLPDRPGAVIAKRINILGQVTGYMGTADGTRAFRWTAGTLEDLGVLDGFPNSFGHVINYGGQVAGILQAHDLQHAFRYTDGVGMEDLGGIGELAAPFGINARGDVVGDIGLKENAPRGFLFTDGAGLQYLDDLIDPGLLLGITGARDINDAGQIVGSAYSKLDGRGFAVRLIPGWSAGDSVTITRAEYSVSRARLKVDATDTTEGATLTVWATATGQYIGTLQSKGGGKFSGQFWWWVNPETITVRSTFGGSATRDVTLRR